MNSLPCGFAFGCRVVCLCSDVLRARPIEFEGGAISGCSCPRSLTRCFESQCLF